MSEPTTLSAQQPTTTSSSASSTPGTSSTSSTSPSYYSTSSSSATSHSSTPTPTVHSLAPTPAPSRNPSLFPGADNSPAALGLGLFGGGGGASGGAPGSNGRTAHLTAAQPGGRHFANNADYINALAAAAQASLQSAPSSPGADLPIARSSGKRSSIYGGAMGGGGGVGVQEQQQQQQQQSLPERLNEMLVDEEREREAESEEKEGGEREEGENGESRAADRATELPPLMTTSMHPPPTARAQQPAFDPARGSFLDVDSITPVTTPGSVDHQGILWSGGGAARGGPVSGAAGARAVDEMEVEEEEEEEEQYEGFVDPFARARAGVSVAKGEGLVQQAGVMMNGHQQQQQQQRSAAQEGALNGGSGQEQDGMSSDRQ